MQIRKNTTRKWDPELYKQVDSRLEPEVFVYKCYVQPRTENIAICKHFYLLSFSHKITRSKQSGKGFQKRTLCV